MKKDPYRNLTRDQLVSRIKSLENLLFNSNIMYPHHIHQETDQVNVNSRDLDWNKYSFGHIAFKIAYLGWPYQGFASQNPIKPKLDLKIANNSSSFPCSISDVSIPSIPSTTLPPPALTCNFNTVEEYLFTAFKQAKLIRNHPSLCNYSRCGRTDAGVSAINQVIAMTIRTTDIHGNPLPLMTILNRLLPDYIQVIDWSPVTDSFNARFDCKWREYHYSFPIFPPFPPSPHSQSTLSLINDDHENNNSHNCNGNGKNKKNPKSTTILNIELMQQAANLLIGHHNMKMFGKRDPSKPEDNSISINWHRHIYQSQITVTEMKTKTNNNDHENKKRKESEMKLETNMENNLKMACFKIRGSAFLYHQVRCTMALLLQVGKGEMSLLDFQNLLNDSFSMTSPRPTVQMVDPEPLVLYNVHYDESKVKWNWMASLEEKTKLVLKIQRLWKQSLSQSATISKLIECQLLNGNDKIIDQE